MIKNIERSILETTWRDNFKICNDVTDEFDWSVSMIYAFHWLLILFSKFDLASVRCDGDENVFKSVERNGIWLNHAWFCERDHYKRFYTREWVKKEVKSLYKQCCYDVYTRIMARLLPMFIPQGTFYYLFSIILLKLLGFE